MRVFERTRTIGLCCVCAVTGPAAGQVPLDDHFDTAMHPDWVVVRGGAEVVDGWLVLSRTDVGSPRDSAVVFRDGDESIRDFVLHVRADPDLSLGTWERSHVGFRLTGAWTPSASGYYLSLVFPGDGSGSRATFTRQVNGVVTELARVQPFNAAQPVDVVIRAAGSVIDVFVNGGHLFAINDPGGPAGGGVTLWSVWESSGRYDDVVLTLLEGPCAGDANLDGSVTFVDVTTVLANFLTVCP
jgi:hypothetical protein